MSPRDGSRVDPTGSLGGLRIHPRKRFALLEEIAADIDAMEDELAARGFPRGRARAAAIDRLYPGLAVVRELEAEEVAYRRLADRFGAEPVVFTERIGLGLVAMLTLVALAIGLARLDAFRSGGAFVWGSIVVISALVTNTLRVAFGLWVRQDMDAAARRRAWRIQVGLVLVATSIGGLGAAVESYVAAGSLAVRPEWGIGFALMRDVMLLAGLSLGAIVIGLSGWLALTPSLRSYDAFERRIAAAFGPVGPRLVRGTAEPPRSGHASPQDPGEVPL